MELLRSIGIHDGSFHADEVTACALLILFDLVDRNKILRSRNQVDLDECEYVCDVGGIYNPLIKRFDHHQVDYIGEMSSAGMILKYLHDEDVIDKGIFSYFKDHLVDGVDAIDNGRDQPKTGHASFSSVIANFMPVSYLATPEEVERAFYSALAFTVDHLTRLLDRYQYIVECAGFVKEAMAANSDVLQFDEPMPWMEAFFEYGGEEHPAQFLIMPAKEHWKLRGIPPNLADRMNVRSPLPKEWAGLLGDALKKASEIPGAIFCHKGQFISIWETKADALKALKYVRKQK